MRVPLHVLVSWHLIFVACLFLLSLDVVPWWSSKLHARHYEPLSGRYCNAFPSHPSVIGSRWPSLSSFSFGFGALLCLLYGRSGSSLGLSLYGLWLCGISFAFHATYRHDYWRLDINSVRAFPYVIAAALFCGTFRRRMLYDLFSFFVIVGFPVVFSVGEYGNTSSSVGIIVSGVILIGVSLVYAWPRLVDPSTSFLFVFFLVLGGLFIFLQSVPWACPISPVSLGHSFLGVCFGVYPFLYRGPTSLS